MFDIFNLLIIVACALVINGAYILLFPLIDNDKQEGSTRVALLVDALLCIYIAVFTFIKIL